MWGYKNQINSIYIYKRISNQDAYIYIYLAYINNKFRKHMINSKLDEFENIINSKM